MTDTCNAGAIWGTAGRCGSWQWSEIWDYLRIEPDPQCIWVFALTDNGATCDG